VSTTALLPSPHNPYSPFDRPSSQPATAFLAWQTDRIDDFRMVDSQPFRECIESVCDMPVVTLGGSSDVSNQHLADPPITGSVMPSTVEREDRIFVAGHTGLVGSALLRQLQSAGFEHLLTMPHSALDLCDRVAVDQWFREAQPEVVIHAAGRVGGIAANLSAPVEFLYDNLMMHATVLRAAWRHGVKKLLYLGSSCVYPRECPQPMREEYLLSSPLEPSNEAYALAKIVGLKSCQYYRRQYDCNFIAAMPTNLYGPNDNFNPNNSHVLPALLQKFHEAKVADKKQVSIWGSGTPRRELLHVDDLADACLFLLQNYHDESIINVGTGEDVSIAELADLVREIVYPEAELTFDPTRPDGPPRKLLCVDRLRRIGWRHRINLREGIESTYAWFLKHESP